MENLFLEILRVLDIRYNKVNTDFYFFSYDYYKLLLADNINNESLLNIFIRNKSQNKSLFMISKLNDDEEIKKINFENPEFNFYKSRNILFFICIFLRYLVFDNIDNYKFEKDFINEFLDDKIIENFINIINQLKTKKFITLYQEKDNLIKKINSNYNSNNEIYDYLKLALNLYFENNVFTIGLKKSLDYHFEVSIFYLIFNIVSDKIIGSKMSTIYSNLET